MTLRHKRTANPDSLRLFDRDLPPASLTAEQIRRKATNERRVTTRAL